jgi:hypothetical protein
MKRVSAKDPGKTNAFTVMSTFFVRGKKEQQEWWAATAYSDDEAPEFQSRRDVTLRKQL